MIVPSEFSFFDLGGAANMDIDGASIMLASFLISYVVLVFHISKVWIHFSSYVVKVQVSHAYIKLDITGLCGVGATSA